MGTGSTVPRWFAEIQFCERFSCTEKELYEDFSRAFFNKVQAVNEIENSVHKAKEQAAKAQQRRG